MCMGGREVGDATCILGPSIQGEGIPAESCCIGGSCWEGEVCWGER